MLAFNKFVRGSVFPLSSLTYILLSVDKGLGPVHQVIRNLNLAMQQGYKPLSFMFGCVSGCRCHLSLQLLGFSEKPSLQRGSNSP